jgi:hypothetical protein
MILSEVMQIAKNYAKKSFITLAAGHAVIKLFTCVIYELSLEAKVFHPGKPCQPNVMFMGNP